MTMFNRLARVGLTTALVAGSIALGATGASATTNGPANPGVSVVVRGLDNPRGLAFGPGGVLYIAEAGHGGPMALGAGPEGPLYGGLTGRLGVWSNGTLTHPITGLFSAAGSTGIGAEGFVSVSTRGLTVTGQFGESSSVIPPTVPPGIPIVDAARAELGRTVSIDPMAGTWMALARTGDADFAWTGAHPSLDPEFPDANPNAVITVGQTRYVADAGANLIAKVDRMGAVTTLAYLDVPAGSMTDGVPTCLAEAADGSLYVGELLGGTFAPGGARVWQVWPNGTATVKWTGFSTIQGCGFDEVGNFYVTEFQANGFNPSPTGDPLGAVVQITPTGHRTTFGMGSLFYPSGFAYRDGWVYVSNWSIMPASNHGGPTGQLVRIAVG